jgi:hypothetical protein
MVRTDAAGSNPQNRLKNALNAPSMSAPGEVPVAAHAHFGQVGRTWLDGALAEAAVSLSNESRRQNDPSGIE